MTARVAGRVAVVGAGLSGAACATALRRRGVVVEVFDRGRGPGGRLSPSRLEHRPVDLGAAYFTVADPAFAALVDGWTADGTVRRWTDTLAVFSDDGPRTTSGPMRHAAPDGLGTLVAALAGDVTAGHEVAELADLSHDAVVLAMPDPQAARLAPDAGAAVGGWVDYEPVIAVAAAYAQRRWEPFAAAFVNGDADVALLLDDGARRGDGAPVLVAHSTGERARAHLDAPDDAVAPVLAAAARLLGLPGDEPPRATRAHRWTFAKPAGTHGDAPFGLVEHEGRPLGLCGDSWCPSGKPRVEAAWLSGHRLAGALADRLRAP